MRRVRRSAPAAQIAVVRHGGRLARAAAVRLWVPIILSWSLTWSLVPSKLADSVRGHLKIGHCQ
jgi:hypothetical protein